MSAGDTIRDLVLGCRRCRKQSARREGCPPLRLREQAADASARQTSPEG
jgi:hypothetical protein